MFSMKKYFGFVFFLLILSIPLYLAAQTDFFPLGIYNYDVCGGVHTLDQANEMANIDGLHVNYFSEMSIVAQPGIIDTS